MMDDIERERDVLEREGRRKNADNIRRDDSTTAGFRGLSDCFELLFDMVSRAAGGGPILVFRWRPPSYFIEY